MKEVREKAGLSQEQLAQLLGTSWVTVSRWERGLTEPSPAVGARIERLRKLLIEIADALPPEEVPKFLRKPHALLRGFSPVELLESEYGFQDLMAFVAAAKSGDMA